MARAFIAYVFYISCLFNIGVCLFLLEELKLINYEVDILKTPVKVGEEQFYPMLHMKSKYGQQYQCLLPHVEESESAEKKETPAEENIDVKDLLQPVQGNSCLLKTKDWWTYEFCFGHYIKQYHIEDGKIIGQVITLGLYESDYEWNNETDEDKFRHVKQKYHSQIYSNGSRCDLTGLPRNAEVRFFCEEDAGDYIYRVDEPGTCSYVLTIHTARLCSHPRLKPLPSDKAHVISCNPLLDEEQYSLYLHKIDDEKTSAEMKRNSWLTNQQERLKVMKTWSKDSFFDAEKEIGKLESSIDIGTEIEKLKSVIPPERFASVKDDIQKQFDSIINEAEEELHPNINDESKDAAFSKLASTLNMLLDKLDKAEKDVAKATQELEKVQSVITTTKPGHLADDEQDDTDDEDLENESVAESNYQSFSKEYLQKAGKLQGTDGHQSQSAIFDDDKLHVRIRRLEKKSPDANGELHEMDFAQRKKLEQAVKERLEKSGLDTGGRRIEVKIITAGYYDNEDGKDFHSLSDDETSQFQNMIMALLTGQQEAIQEMERHKKLEENYKFVWSNDKDTEVNDED